MRRSKRTSIRTETKELLIIRRTDLFKNRSRCVECEADVRWLTFGDAAKTNELRAGELSGFMEAGRVHFRETPEGHLLLCLNSLAVVSNERMETADSQTPTNIPGDKA